MNYIFQLEMKVRDYECDLQGIVNNANYLHYLEHTRHEFLLANGMSFAQLHDEGIDVVVAHVDIAYKAPLRSRDEFISRLALTSDGIKYTFLQTITRKSDNKLSLRAKIDCVSIIGGQLSRSKKIDDFIEKINSSNTIGNHA